MNKTLYYLAVFLLIFLPLNTGAVERIAEPISPSLWDSYLPEPAHPSFASDLGSLYEGRLSFGFQGKDLVHLSLSVQGLQIISAHSEWYVGDSERLAYAPEYAYLAIGDDKEKPFPKRYRNMFRVSGGLRLSNFMMSLQDWDIGAGFTFTDIAVADENDNRIWSSSRIGFSSSLQYKKLLLSGAWDKEEQRYRFGYNEPNDIQVGLEFYSSFQNKSSYGVQTGTEKTFRESLKAKAGLRWQWADNKRIENIMMLGVGIRFRPWRKDIDPAWLQSIVAPFGYIPTLQRFFYDWELSMNSAIDMNYGSLSWGFSLARWF